MNLTETFQAFCRVLVLCYTPLKLGQNIFKFNLLCWILCPQICDCILKFIFEFLGWLYGTVNGRVGMFPGDHIESLPIHAVEQRPPANKVPKNLNRFRHML